MATKAEVIDYVVEIGRKNGYSDTAIAGILGNVVGEAGSKMNHNAYNSTGGGWGAYGLFQHRGSRLEGMAKYAGVSLDRSKKGSKNAIPEISAKKQVEWMFRELNMPEYSAAKKGLMAATTPREAAKSFMSKFERPSAHHQKTSLPTRAGAATSLFNSGFKSTGGKDSKSQFAETPAVGPIPTARESQIASPAVPTIAPNAAGKLIDDMAAMPMNQPLASVAAYRQESNTGKNASQVFDMVLGGTPALAAQKAAAQAAPVNTPQVQGFESLQYTPVKTTSFTAPAAMAPAPATPTEAKQSQKGAPASSAKGNGSGPSVAPATPTVSLADIGFPMGNQVVAVPAAAGWGAGAVPSVNLNPTAPAKNAVPGTVPPSGLIDFDAQFDEAGKPKSSPALNPVAPAPDEEEEVGSVAVQAKAAPTTQSKKTGGFSSFIDRIFGGGSSFGSMFGGTPANFDAPKSNIGAGYEAIAATFGAPAGSIATSKSNPNVTFESLGNGYVQRSNATTGMTEILAPGDYDPGTSSSSKSSASSKGSEGKSSGSSKK